MLRESGAYRQGCFEVKPPRSIAQREREAPYL